MPSDNTTKPGTFIPTREQLNADISIDSSSEAAVTKSLFPKSQKVDKSGKSVQVKKKWAAWLKSRSA